MEHSILEKMLLIRRVEEEIVKRYPKQLMRCPVHLGINQEAIAVGACHHLRKEDSVFSTHRSHNHYIAKNGNIEKAALEIHGKVGGCTEGRGGSMHLMDKSVNVMSIPIVASAIPLAVGTALANKIDGNDNVVVCFFGDAAVEEGVFHESLNFASLMQLPIIFICEDNRYSVDTHINKRQPKRSIADFGYAHKIATHHFSTNDASALAIQFRTFIEKTRLGTPHFIVCDTKRSHVHCGIEKEFDLENDPLDAAKDYDDTEIMARITAAFDAAEVAPLPNPEMAKEYVYAS